MADPQIPDPRTRRREAALDRFGRQRVRGTSTRQILAAAAMPPPPPAIPLPAGSSTSPDFEPKWLRSNLRNAGGFAIVSAGDRRAWRAGRELDLADQHR